MNSQIPNVYAVEIIETVQIDGRYFLRNRQYPHVRSYVGGSILIDALYKKQEFHVVLVDDTEYSIPDNYCIITNHIKTELEQDIVKYIELTRRDNISNRFDTYVKSLPLATNKNNFGEPVYSMSWYEDYLKKIRG
jgi:hypothetical protein